MSQLIAGPEDRYHFVANVVGSSAVPTNLNLHTSEVCISLEFLKANVWVLLR